MWKIFFLLSIANIHCMSRIGSIRNATYVSSNISAVITYNNTCTECVCRAFFSAKPSLYVGLNCFGNNKTCTLFTNFSASTTIQANPDSTFIFIQPPTPPQNTTAVTTMKLGTTVAGNANGVSGAGNQSFNGPVDVCMGSDGTLFVADWENKRVQAFVSGSQVGTTVISSTGKPQAVYVDGLSNLYVTWGGQDQVTIQPSGVNLPPTALSTCAWANSLHDAYGIAADRSGNIYVTSSSCNFITLWRENRTNATRLIANSSLVGQPRHMYLDEDSALLYVADTLNHRIVKIFLNGSAPAQTVAGSNGASGTTPNKLNKPAGVYVSRIDGTIYVADTGNHRIQKFLVGATAGTTVAGNANGTSGSSGYALNGPYAVVLNSDETFFYVADYYNNRIQRFSIQ